MINTSIVSNDITARTMSDAAEQRAEHLAALGCSNVIELCVGPSLKILEGFYTKHRITVTGNDIEKRWKAYYPQGKWLIGDALKLSYADFDGVVFAPPLSRGCTGRREDALMINQVFPKYTDFFARAKEQKIKVGVMVCPARSLATSSDRAQLHHLLGQIAMSNYKSEVIPLQAKKRNITKYVDIYFYQ